MLQSLFFFDSLSWLFYVWPDQPLLLGLSSFMSAINVWLVLALREGKNREVKNVLGALGLEVNRLIRISYGPFQLGDLPAHMRLAGAVQQRDLAQAAVVGGVEEQAPEVEVHVRPMRKTYV